MPARFQLVIDCTDPDRLARFWAAALGYVLEPPPEGFANWDDWRRDVGFPDDELGIGADSIIDPRGEGPRIWFRVEPDAKVVKNRLHFDIHASTDGPYLSSVRKVPIEVRTQRRWIVMSSIRFVSPVSCDGRQYVSRFSVVDAEEQVQEDDQDAESQPAQAAPVAVVHEA